MSGLARLQQEMADVGRNPGVGLRVAGPEAEAAGRGLHGLQAADGRLDQPGRSGGVEPPGRQIGGQGREVEQRESLGHGLLCAAVRVAQQVLQLSREARERRRGQAHRAPDRAGDQPVRGRSGDPPRLLPEGRVLQQAFHGQGRALVKLLPGRGSLPVPGGREGQADLALFGAAAQGHVHGAFAPRFKGQGGGHVAQAGRAGNRGGDAEFPGRRRVVAQGQGDLDGVARGQEARQGRGQDQGAAHAGHCRARAEGAVAVGHGHDAQGALEVGQPQAVGRGAVGPGREHAGPEGHGAHPADAFGAHEGRGRGQGVAAAGQGPVQGQVREEQGEVVEAGHVQGPLGVEVPEGVGVAAAGQLHDALVHGGHGHARAGLGLDRDAQVRLGARFGRGVHAHVHPVGQAVHEQRDGAEGAARGAGQDVPGSADQGGREVHVGLPVLAHGDAQLARVAGQLDDFEVLHAAPFDRDQSLAREGGADLDRGCLAGPVPFLVRDQLQAGRVLDRPGRIAPPAAVEFDLGRGPALGVGQAHPVGAVVRRDHAEGARAVARGHALGRDLDGVAHGLVGEAFLRAPHDRLPAVLEEGGDQLRVLRAGAVGGHGHEFEGRRLARFQFRGLGSLEARVEAVGVHRHAPPGRDPAPALLAHAARQFGFEGQGRGEIFGDVDGEDGAPFGVQPGFGCQDGQGLECAPRVAEGVGLEALGREARGHEPGLDVCGQVRGRRPEEVARRHFKRQDLAGRGPGAVGGDLHADAVGDELLDLVGPGADDPAGAHDLQQVAPGQGPVGDVQVEGGHAPVRGQVQGAQQAPLGVALLHGQGAVGRRADAAVADQHRAVDGLARPVDVALAVDVGLQVGPADGRAADVEARGVDAEALQEDEAEVFAR
ncbi:hypothetical protein DSECCO2_571330 [anaerobic digester metagenome]